MGAWKLYIIARELKYRKGRYNRSHIRPCGGGPTEKEDESLHENK